MALVGSGILGPGQAEYFNVVLHGGVPYRVYVAPVEPGVDFDLYVYDENGNLVEQDATASSDALCYIKPRWTGPFRLMVKSARGLSGYHIRVED
ncbi:MAG TPA: hypothetical protein VLK82_10245 [Candidatus Tectomicrobia bacterium]|nr:hypothetical protein [Candidatus Tectomicrobia bacterium]